MENTTRKMLVEFLEKIRKGNYPADLLENPDELANKIASDLNCHPSKTMPMLGYLLQLKYVRIDPNLGIVPIQDNN